VAGGPSKLTPEVQQTVVEILSNGGTRTAAAAREKRKSKGCKNQCESFHLDERVSPEPGPKKTDTRVQIQSGEAKISSLFEHLNWRDRKTMLTARTCQRCKRPRCLHAKARCVRESLGCVCRARVAELGAFYGIHCVGYLPFPMFRVELKPRGWSLVLAAQMNIYA
jgi:hypothetical protein